MDEVTVQVRRHRPVPAPPADDLEFQELYSATFPAVVRTVHRILGDRAAAEEVTQEAFIELHLHWAKVRRYDAPAVWVRRVAIRKAQRERHRGWRRDELERTCAPVLAPGTPPDPDEAVHAAVRTLPFKQRAVVVLFYLEDRPMDEIAALLGCSVSSGWSQLHIARRKLAVLLIEEVTDDVG